MDDHTLEKLDYQRIREMLAREAQCALGKSLAMRIAPSRRQPQIALWLTQAKEFASFVAREGLPPFGGIRDVRENVRRAIPPAKLEPDEFAELSATLTGIETVRTYLAQATADFPDIARIGARIGDFRTVSERIDRVIDNRGRVRDDASERLERIRREMDTVREETHEVFDRLLKQPNVTKYLQYANATFHADRMVLPLRSDQRGRVPGIVHRSSDSGQTLFVEPAEAVELNNVLVRLMVEENEEIGRILWELTHLVHVNQTELLKTLETAALIDLLTAKVKLARRYDMHFADLATEHRLKLTRARNPVLLTFFEEETARTGVKHDVVPIDVRLGEDFDIMLITGPNTGGKTAALKTVGMIALMFQSGLPIPAGAPSSMPVFDNVFIDVGDEQSLQQNLSTFSAHLARTLDVIRRAHKSTLVLIDEMGAGTDPDEGAAIGNAVVDRLLALGCVAMITTHLGALKAIGFEMERVDNASVQFDMETLKPTYKLCIGEPGNSNALAIASRLGMPRKMVEAAQRHLTRRGRALNKAIAGTLEVRRQAERARMDADKARQDAARATLAAMDRAAELEVQQKTYATWVQRVMGLRPGDAVRVRRFTDSGRVVRMGFERQQALVAIGAVEVEVPLTDLAFDWSMEIADGLAGLRYMSKSPALQDALETLAGRGVELSQRYRLDFGPQSVEAVRALRYRSDAVGDFSTNGDTSPRRLILIGIVGGASSGKSTLFNNILGGRLASRVSAKGHSTKGPILAVFDGHRDAMESALGRRLLMPAFRHQSIALDANVDGETELLCVVYHHRDELHDVLLFDMPDFTSEPARLEGDIALASLPWFDRILVLVDNERLFDRQTVQRMREESEQFAQERVVLFNRVATARLSDTERDRLAKQAERLGAAEFHVIDDRPGRGLCAIPPAMLEPIIVALRRASGDRSPSLLRHIGAAADRALNQNDHRARRLGQLRESLRRAVSTAAPTRFECMAALMTAEEKRHLDMIWRTLRWSDTRRWFQTGVNKIGRAIRRNVPLIGPLIAPGGSAHEQPQFDPTDRQANGWELFRRTCRRQGDAARQAAERSEFWEEVRRWSAVEPPVPALERIDSERSDVAARVSAFESALRRWSEKVQTECAGVSPHVIGAMGGGALAGFIVLAAVSGPIGALTWGAAKMAIAGAIGKVAATAGAGAMAGKPLGRLVSVVQERLLGSDEYAAVQSAADRFGQAITEFGRSIAEEMYEVSRGLVLSSDDPLYKSLAVVSDAARGQA